MADLDLAPGEDLNAFEARLRDLFSRGQISPEDYFSSCARESARLYLSKDNPRAQSGHGGDVQWWRHVRWMILEAVESGGTFIDVGCANGHLIESLDKWMQDTGVSVEFYGLELSAELHQLALRRLPGFRARLFLGNAVYWKPPLTFDYVYTMILPDIPRELRKEFLVNLFDNYVKPGGRLILGPWNDRGLEEEIAEIGFTPTGHCEKSFLGKPYFTKRLVWIDKRGGGSP